MRRIDKRKDNVFNRFLKRVGNILIQLLENIKMYKKRYIIGLIIIILLTIIYNIVWYNIALTPVNKKDNSEQIFEIRTGESGVVIAQKLENQKIIRSKKAFKIYVNLNKKNKFKAGTYSLKKSQSLKEIVNIFEEGRTEKQKVSIQIIEGKTIKDLAKIIAQKTINKEEDVYAKLKDTEYLKRISEKYKFIDYNTVISQQLKYSLEGYLFPDTYMYENKYVNVEQIFEKMLDEMNEKLDKYMKNASLKQQILTPHQILTLASIIEKEAGPSQNYKQNKEKNKLVNNGKRTDRQMVAQIFMNRLYRKMSLGSDVTTYYGLGIELSQRDLTKAELNMSNPYNTRGAGMQGKLPIGPIGFISEESIDIATEISNNYIATDELFFVSDKNGKIYTAKTNEEHENIIKRLKDAKLWYEYN